MAGLLLRILAEQHIINLYSTPVCCLITLSYGFIMFITLSYFVYMCQSPRIHSVNLFTCVDFRAKFAFSRVVSQVDYPSLVDLRGLLLDLVAQLLGALSRIRYIS
jgi:hypothetical protein